MRLGATVRSTRPTGHSPEASQPRSQGRAQGELSSVITGRYELTLRESLSIFGRQGDMPRDRQRGSPCLLCPCSRVSSRAGTSRGRLLGDAMLGPELLRLDPADENQERGGDRRLRRELWWLTARNVQRARPMGPSAFRETTKRSGPGRHHVNSPQFAGRSQPEPGAESSNSPTGQPLLPPTPIPFRIQSCCFCSFFCFLHRNFLG
jgi:hypothetical protein